jgi:molecular chaperone GrpE
MSHDTLSPDPAELAGSAAALDAPPSPDEVAELKDRLLRTLAEMENLRRRTARDAEDARKYAVTGFARGLLEVADNLTRALAAVPPEARAREPLLQTFHEGVELTRRSLLALFEKHEIGVVAPAVGDRFDHNLHQAMFEQPSDTLPPGSIAEVLQQGYVIADRLLRPALVGVAKAAPRPAAPAAAAAGGEPGGEGGAGA